jgi:hypothetical protein
MGLIVSPALIPYTHGLSGDRRHIDVVLISIKKVLILKQLRLIVE